MSITPLDILKKKRSTLRSVLSNAMTAIGTMTAASPALNAKRASIEKTAKELKAIDDEIFNASMDLSEDQLVAQLEAANSYQEKATQVLAETPEVKYDAHEEEEDTPEIETSTPSINTTRTRLPKIKFEEYDLSPRNYLQFWAQFQPVYENETLHYSEKFFYLKQSLKGKAKGIVESYPPSDENFEKAVSQLKRRYGKENLIVEVHIRNLLELVLNKNLSLPTLYDKLNTQIRALESLGLTSGSYNSFLYPLVESALPTEILKIWTRTRPSQLDGSSPNLNLNEEEQDDLTSLMAFIEKEVEGEERVKLAQGTVPKSKPTAAAPESPRQATSSAMVSTGGGVNGKTCGFCGYHHFTSECRKASKMTYEERRAALMKGKCCLLCLRKNHIAKFCSSKISCTSCNKNHATIMCPDQVKDAVPSMHAYRSGPIFLKTLMVKLNGKFVRAFLDDGSHRSYITKSLASSLQLEPTGEEKFAHGLFGGRTTTEVRHNRYDITLSGVQKPYNLVKVSVLDEHTLCAKLPRVADTQVLRELAERGIRLSDVGPDTPPVELLLGADAIGRLLTGRMEIFSSGLSAIETKLGWVVVGAAPKSSVSMISFSLNVCQLPQLWELETIGISDPIEKVSNKVLAKETLEHFESSVKRQEDGRYEVAIPWLDGHPPLPTGLDTAENRLRAVTKKLQRQNLLVPYDEVFQKWESEGIIEEVKEPADTLLHYLPHRPVIREGKTTKIRPVFDPSHKKPGEVSLNECLSVGPNLTEQVLPVLLRFRVGEDATTADIRQAFQMISVKEEDRDALRFLWWRDGSCTEYKIMRHARVPFGLACSPFLLNATVAHHIRLPVYNTAKYLDTVERMSKSFYVDDAVYSGKKAEVDDFITQSQEIMIEGQFELRGWTRNSPDSDETKGVLGILWHVGKDEISFAVPEYDTSKPANKRSVLAVISKVYDPIGVTAPALIPPKILLQECWRRKLSWDEPLPEDLMNQFLSWVKHLHEMELLTIPRRCIDTELVHCSLHVMSDGSQHAYGACVYIRCESQYGVSLQLVAAKARVTPLSNNSIPRIELLGCGLGVRLSQAVQDALQPLKCYYWTDSTVALAWIKCNEPWNTFVGNRVKEIRQYTNSEDWQHVNGCHNQQADLLSRGCNFQILSRSHWWEGPEWLLQPEPSWPASSTESLPSEALVERRKTVASATNLEPEEGITAVITTHCSSYKKAKRVCGWIFRFSHNARHKHSKLTGDLSTEEVIVGERGLFKALQSEWPEREKIKLFSHLDVEEDQDGVLRLRTKLIHGDDSDYFQRPILLPEHAITKLMVAEAHLAVGHAGVATTITYLRQTYWIHRARKLARSVASACVVCKRFRAKHMTAKPSALPTDRIKIVKPFQVTGCDAAGPLFLKSGEKAYIILFTCAVFRAVHLELVLSLSADTFLQALRRFIARRGRCDVIRCDNGGNFVAASRALSSLDWDKVQAFSSISKIKFIFNVPSAPWWTGFVERMVGVVKSVLKKSLGRALLTYQEMQTMLCEAESCVNSRPITYVSDDASELTPLTPAHFIQTIPCADVSDLDLIDSEHPVKRFRYLQKVREGLAARFRDEYLAELVKSPQILEKRRDLQPGDVVLIGSDNVKRQSWPMARVVSLVKGKDGVVRTLQVRLPQGDLYRPIQRLYPLEVDTSMSPRAESNEGECEFELPGDTTELLDNGSETLDTESEYESQQLSPLSSLLPHSPSQIDDVVKIVSRTGRLVKPPARLDL